MTLPLPGTFGYEPYGSGVYGGGTYPIFVDEVAFASNPFDSPQIWTDLTPRTRVRSWSRGRQSESDTPDTGRSTTIFENADRQLDPSNAASIYAPNVLPMRRIRSSVTLAGTTYDFYSHFIDPEQGWLQNQTGPGYAEATVAANDGFDILSTLLLDASAAYLQQPAGQRIAAILDTVLWPAADRNVDVISAQSDVQAAVAGSLNGVSALDAIQAAAANDNGIFYIDGNGRAVFKGRNRQSDARYSTSQATFTDAHNFVPGFTYYESITPVSSKIVNDWRVTRAGGTEQPWSDATSIAKYGRRTRRVSTLHVSDAEALAYAQYRVNLDKDPRRRYDEMTVRPLDDAAVWLLLFTLDIGDRITVMYSPPGGGAPDVRDMHIEAIRASIGPGPDSTWTFRLSPASDQIGWVLGDAVYGLLGSTTVLTY